MVMTHRDLNQGLGQETFAMKGGHMQSSFLPLSSDEVHYAGQIVGLVVADTQEAAEQAARAITLATRPSPPPPTWKTRGTTRKPRRSPLPRWAMPTPRSRGRR